MGKGKSRGENGRKIYRNLNQRKRKKNWKAEMIWHTAIFFLSIFVFFFSFFLFFFQIFFNADIYPAM